MHQLFEGWIQLAMSYCRKYWNPINLFFQKLYLVWIASQRDELSKRWSSGVRELPF